MSRVNGLIDAAPEPIPALAKEYSELESRALEARRTVKDLEARRPKAEQEDRSALARAMRAGEPDPRSEHAKQLEAKIEEAVREHQALSDAQRMAHDDLIGELTGDGGAKWAHHLRASRSAHASRAAEALAAALTALDEVERFRGSETWLENVVAKRRIAPGRTPRRIKVGMGDPEAGLRDQLRRAQDEMRGWESAS